MKKKNFLPVSRGELRAITITSLIICLSVILPPHLIRILHSQTLPKVEIKELGESEVTRGFAHDISTIPEGSKDAGKTTSYRQANDNTSFEHTIPSHSGLNTSDLGKKLNNKPRIDVRCSAFDPNEIVSDTLAAWGFPSKVISNIMRYRSSGGKFRQPEDIKKIYGLDIRLYQKIKSCINIARKPLVKVNINSADTAQWMALPGIGPVLSKRIIAFREKLGGFYSVDQIAKTYGLSPEVFEMIKPNLRILSKPKLTDLTTATQSQLAGVPYISEKQARVMIQYFERHGRPESFDDLSALYIADSLWLSRIKPYLTIEKIAN